MKHTLFFALCAPLLLAGCSNDDEPAGPVLPSTMSAVEFDGALPCVDFYGSDSKTAIMEYETAAGRTYSIGEGSAMQMVFAAPSGSISRVRYDFRSSRQYDGATLAGVSSEDIWSRGFIAKLTASGYEIVAQSDARVELSNSRLKVKVEVLRTDAGGAAAARFSPTESLPTLPDYQQELIHPFHVLGSTLEEVKAGEAASGRTLYRVEGSDALFSSYPPEGSVFQVFGFSFDDAGKLESVMSVLWDGTWLDTEEFKSAMADDGFVFERRDGSYSYFRSLDGSVVARSANIQPNPTIEYLDPDSILLE